MQVNQVNVLSIGTAWPRGISAAWEVGALWGEFLVQSTGTVYISLKLQISPSNYKYSNDADKRSITGHLRIPPEGSQPCYTTFISIIIVALLIHLILYPKPFGNGPPFTHQIVTIVEIQTNDLRAPRPRRKFSVRAETTTHLNRDVHGAQLQRGDRVAVTSCLIAAHTQFDAPRAVEAEARIRSQSKANLRDAQTYTFTHHFYPRLPPHLLSTLPTSLFPPL